MNLLLTIKHALRTLKERRRRKARFNRNQTHNGDKDSYPLFREYKRTMSGVCGAFTWMDLRKHIVTLNKAKRK